MNVCCTRCSTIECVMWKQEDSGFGQGACQVDSSFCVDTKEDTEDKTPTKAALDRVRCHTKRKKIKQREIASLEMRELARQSGARSDIYSLYRPSGKTSVHGKSCYRSSKQWSLLGLTCRLSHVASPRPLSDSFLRLSVPSSGPLRYTRVRVLRAYGLSIKWPFFHVRPNP